MKRAGKVALAVGGMVLAGAVAAPLIGSPTDFAVGVTLGACGALALLAAAGKLTTVSKRLPVTEWHVWDEELEAGLSGTERDMQRKGMAVLTGWPFHGDHDASTYDHGTVVYRNGTEVAP